MIIQIWKSLPNIEQCMHQKQNKQKVQNKIKTKTKVTLNKLCYNYDWHEKSIWKIKSKFKNLAYLKIIIYILLEIWGKAQRESARRPKSNWGKLEGEGKISPASKSRGPNSNALVYAERALST